MSSLITCYSHFFRFWASIHRNRWDLTYFNLMNHLLWHWMKDLYLNLNGFWCILI